MRLDRILDFAPPPPADRVAHFQAMHDRSIALNRMRPVGTTSPLPSLSDVWERNPWAAKTFNLTRQCLVINADPKVAAALEHAARKHEGAL